MSKVQIRANEFADRKLTTPKGKVPLVIGYMQGAQDKNKIDIVNAQCFFEPLILNIIKNEEDLQIIRDNFAKFMTL